MVKVLLVDDDELNRDMLSRRLVRNNYTVVIAVNGEESIRMAETNQPDIILMDMNMPMMDGLEATRQIKNNPLTANIPILILSAHAMPSYAAKAIAGGGDDYDTKPIDLERLLGKIQALIKK
ncbi:MAG: response regulator [Methylococcales bacterium]|nr:response regulator [Methylococcales bacterium]MDD5755353.1 response regulator [Methylococcales bacterium]